MSKEPSETKSWGARWIVPVDRSPLQDASLTVVDGLITEVTNGGRTSADEDLGDVALIPLLVNAHTHLEFSTLSQPLGRRGNSITDWIPEVIAWRASQSASDVKAAVVSGLHESRFWGSAGIGEIATTPWFEQVDPGRDIHVNVFVERLGINPGDSERKIEEAKTWIHGLENSWLRPGISPHAPYSLCNELFERLIEWAVSSRLPVAMHLAESLEELQWMQSGDGPFFDLLNELGVHRPTHSNRGALHYLRGLAKTVNALVVHGNYLADIELDFLAQHKNLHVVFCPRTHMYFEHNQYPLQEFLRRGINVAIGTDSRASSPDLNLLAELRMIRQMFPGLSPQTILEMGTINGARALQFDRRLGSLTPGKQGKFLEIPVDSKNDPLESIFAKPI